LGGGLKPTNDGPCPFLRIATEGLIAFSTAWNGGGVVDGMPFSGKMPFLSLESLWIVCQEVRESNISGGGRVMYWLFWP